MAVPGQPITRHTRHQDDHIPGRNRTARSRLSGCHQVSDGADCLKSQINVDRTAWLTALPTSSTLRCNSDFGCVTLSERSATTRLRVVADGVAPTAVKGGIGAVRSGARQGARARPQSCALNDAWTSRRTSTLGTTGSTSRACPMQANPMCRRAGAGGLEVQAPAEEDEAIEFRLPKVDGDLGRICSAEEVEAWKLLWGLCCCGSAAG